MLGVSAVLGSPERAEVEMRAWRKQPEHTNEPPEEPDFPVDYLPPLLISAGRVRDITKGSSASGNADANSQYYW